MASIRKDLVKYKAHNVALYWKLEPRAFVEHCLNKLRNHELLSLDDIDTEGKIWYHRKKVLEGNASE